MDFSLIKNDTLRRLVSESGKFAALAPESQKEHLQAMSDITRKRELELIEFFAEQNTLELTPDEKLKMLEGLFDELSGLQKRFKKIMDKQPEKRARKKDEVEMREVMDELKNH